MGYPIQFDLISGQVDLVIIGVEHLNPRAEVEVFIENSSAIAGLVFIDKQGAHRKVDERIGRIGCGDIEVDPIAASVAGASI